MFKYKIVQKPRQILNKNNEKMYDIEFYVNLPFQIKEFYQATLTEHANGTLECSIISKDREVEEYNNKKIKKFDKTSLYRCIKIFTDDIFDLIGH